MAGPLLLQLDMHQAPDLEVALAGEQPSSNGHRRHGPGISYTPNLAAPRPCRSTPARTASSPHQAAAVIIGTTARPMSDPQPHLQPQDLGPDAATILSELADDLEERWADGGTEGTKFARVDDAVRQRISKLGEHHKVFEGKRLGLVRFQMNMIYSTSTPTYFIPLKVEPGVSSISDIPLKVGQVIYSTTSVRVVSPLDALLLEAKT